MPMHFLDRVHRPARRTIAISTVLKVSLEDWLQHELGSGLDHPIADRRNAERSLASIRFRYHHSPHRIRPVPLRDQFLAQARQPTLQTRRLDRGKGHSVRAWRTRIGAGHRIGVTEDVFAVNLVVEQVEAEGRLRLRLAIELSLKDPDLFRCCQAHRQSPSPLHLRKRTRSQGSFPPPALPGLNGRMTLSDSRPSRPLEATLRPLPSPRTGLPRLPEPPSRRAVPTTPADRAGARVDCFPTHTAFPKCQEGRHPHCHFRGLLRLHSRYRPPDRSAAHGDLCHEAPALPVTRPSRSSATRSIDNSLGGFFLH